MINDRLTLGSLFDGSGGFPLAGTLSGIKPVWSSEIEPFPVRVTTKRFPDVKHYGDVSAINGAEIEPVDIITFGSPCQDMSVAGKRAGLDGSRSNLFYEAVRIIKEMRSSTDGRYPRYAVWENVPGAFSSNRGEDFRCVLEALCRIKDETASVPFSGKWLDAGYIMADGFSLAWRVLDAQYWGVPQRRKRIYLVCDFAGGCAPEILFESEGLSGYSAEGFRSWKGTAGDTEKGTGEASFDRYGRELTTAETDTPKTLKIRSGKEGGGKGALMQNDKSATLATNNDQTVFIPQSWDGSQISPTLTKQNAGGNQRMPDKDNFNCVLQPGTITLETFHCSTAEEKTMPLKARGYKDPTVITEPSFGLDRAAFNQGKNALYNFAVKKELEPTIVAKGPGAVAQSHGFYPQMKAECVTLTEDKSVTLVNGTNPGYQNGVIDAGYTVRRLTPVECARLQGFPDRWCSGLETDNPSNEELRFWYDVFETHRKITNPSGKPKTLKQILKWLKQPCADSAEYKMWGNGIALPCAWFVLAGIVWADGMHN